MVTSDEKLTQMRDPLFVIATAIEIIKLQPIDESIKPEIKRIESALDNISKIIR